MLNLYIWSNYIAPETVHKFEERHGVRVNLDIYDTNEALLAKVQAGNAAYDVLCPSNYPIEILRAPGAAAPLDHSALPHLSNLDPRFVDRDYDRGNRYSVPYFWGTCGHRLQPAARTGPVDSWAALWDPRFKGRVLMLDDARETLGAALKWKGHSLNATDPAELRDGPAPAAATRSRWCKVYDSANYDDVLLSGDVWLAQGWNGQFAKAHGPGPGPRLRDPEGGRAACSSTAWSSRLAPRTRSWPTPSSTSRWSPRSRPRSAAPCATRRPTARPCRCCRRRSANNPAIFPPDDVLAASS